MKATCVGCVVSHFAALLLPQAKMFFFWGGEKKGEKCGEPVQRTYTTKTGEMKNKIWRRKKLKCPYLQTIIQQGLFVTEQFFTRVNI